MFQKCVINHDDEQSIIGIIIMGMDGVTRAVTGAEQTLAGRSSLHLPALCSVVCSSAFCSALCCVVCSSAFCSVLCCVVCSSALCSLGLLCVALPGAASTSAWGSRERQTAGR